MVNDIKVYMDMFQSEPEPQVVKIEELIDQVLRKLGAGNKYPNVKVDTDFNENAKYLRVDPVWFEYLFFYIIQNSMEAADKEKTLYQNIFTGREEPTP